MPANPLEPLFEAARPQAVDGPTFRYATVTGVDPVRVRLDGDAAPVASTPTTLVPVVVGDRVRVMIYHRQLEILGVVSAHHLATVTEFGPGMTPLDRGHLPRVHRTGQLVQMTGAVRVVVPTGNVHALILTVPAPFRPATGHTRFIGAGVTNSGAAFELVMANGNVTVPAGYLTGSFGADPVVPVTAAWALD